MQDSQLLLEVSNNNQTLVAVVQQDQQTAYFYIHPVDEHETRFPVRACWLRNLISAPHTDDQTSVMKGIPPLLAAAYCVEADALPPLQADDLLVIWNESDDGAALWFQDQLLAVIPGVSLYSDSPVCYAAACRYPNALVDTLSGDTGRRYALQAAQSRELWWRWSQEENNPWPERHAELIAAYRQHFGPEVQYYVIDNNQWPPMAISQHRHDDVMIFTTLGVSNRPQPWVDSLFSAEASCFRRVELALAVDMTSFSLDQALDMASALAAFAHFPWITLNWMGEGHVLPSAVAPSGYQGYLLSTQLCEPSDNILLPDFDSDSVTLLWATPVYADEMSLVWNNEQGATELIQRLKSRNIGHLCRDRMPVV